MQINEELSLVTFDRLVRSDRDFGTAAEAIKLPKPAECAVAPNAKGVLANRTLQEIHDSASAAAARLRVALTAG